MSAESTGSTTCCSDRVFHYVQHHRVLDFARLGWLPHFELLDTHHGQYAITMEWLCDCPITTPARQRQDAKPEPG